MPNCRKNAISGGNCKGIKRITDGRKRKTQTSKYTTTKNKAQKNTDENSSVLFVLYRIETRENYWFVNI